MPTNDAARGFRWPFVSRTAYEQVVADRDFYRAEFLKALRPEPKAPKAPPKSDEDLVREVETALVQKARQAEAAFVRKLTDDLVRQGVPRPQAEAEARRIRGETMTPVRMA